jgi:putative membrane protein
MKKKIIEFILGGAVIMLMSYLFEGVYVKNFMVAFLVAIVLTFLNTFIKPILSFITFPITFMTFGLFQLVINAIVLSITESLLAPDFYVRGFFLKIIVSILISLLYSYLGIGEHE